VRPRALETVCWIALLASCAARSAADAGGGTDAARLGQGAADSGSFAAPDSKAAGQATIALDGGAPEASVVHQLCQDACATLAMVACPDRQPTCAQNCEQSQMTGPCMAERLAVLACVVATGPSVATCDTLAGRTIFRPGYCTQEQSNLQACVRVTSSS